MSTPDREAWTSSPVTVRGAPPVGILPLAVQLARTAVQWLGFWTAVALPLAYFYLFLHGLTPYELVRLVQLLGLHVVALFAGRGYKAGPPYAVVSSHRDQSI